MSSSSNSSSSGDGATARGIRLRRYAQERFTSGRVDGFRFRVVAYAAVGMSEAIFLCLQRPYNPDTGESAEEFTSVCSPADLEEYPVDAPTGVPPFFRKAEIDLVLRSQRLADQTWEYVKADVASLLRSLEYGDSLVIADNVSFGHPGDGGPSSSSSLSSGGG